MGTYRHQSYKQGQNQFATGCKLRVQAHSCFSTGTHRPLLVCNFIYSGRHVVVIIWYYTHTHTNYNCWNSY